MWGNCVVVTVVVTGSEGGGYLGARMTGIADVTVHINVNRDWIQWEKRYIGGTYTVISKLLFRFYLFHCSDISLFQYFTVSGVSVFDTSSFSQSCNIITARCLLHNTLSS